MVYAAELIQDASIDGQIQRLRIPLCLFEFEGGEFRRQLFVEPLDAFLRIDLDVFWIFDVYGKDAVRILFREPTLLRAGLILHID